MFLQKARSLVDSTEQINNNNYHYIMKNKTKQISLSFFFLFRHLNNQEAVSWNKACLGGDGGGAVIGKIRFLGF